MKFCTKCGKQLEDEAKICTGCGRMLPQMQQSVVREKVKKEKTNAGSNNQIIFNFVYSIVFTLSIFFDIIYATSGSVNFHYYRYSDSLYAYISYDVVFLVFGLLFAIGALIFGILSSVCCIAKKEKIDVVMPAISRMVLPGLLCILHILLFALS